MTFSDIHIICGNFNYQPDCAIFDYWQQFNAWLVKLVMCMSMPYLACPLVFVTSMRLWSWAIVSVWAPCVLIVSCGWDPVPYNYCHYYSLLLCVDEAAYVFNSKQKGGGGGGWWMDSSTYRSNTSDFWLCTDNALTLIMIVHRSLEPPQNSSQI